MNCTATRPTVAELERNERLARDIPKDQMVILLNREGKPLRPKTFAGWCKDFAATLPPSILQDARGNPISLVPHGLRKNACQALWEATGGALAECMAVSGHTNVDTFMHYVRHGQRAGLATLAIGKWEGRTNSERGNYSEPGKQTA